MENQDRVINEKIKEDFLKDRDLVFISSKYPMGATGYILKEQIGTGMNTNKVFLAICPSRSNERVAIKQIDLSQQSKETKEKITKEVMGMSIVTSSEHVVQFHCSFVSEETLWIVMDLQEGSIRDVLKWKYNQGFVDEPIIASIIYQTLQGLNFLHGQRMIHRDIKAGNILFNKEGQIKLADFGVSAILATHDEKRNTMAGTWHWMAPEVIDPSEHGGYDFKADIWSLGITCIELAYGVAPYSQARPNQVIVYILQNDPPSLEEPRVQSNTNKTFSPTFREFVNHCLHKDPQQRPAASKMINHKFFKDLPKPAQMKLALLDGLPTLGERFQKQEEQRQKERLNEAKRVGLSHKIASNRNVSNQVNAKSPRGNDNETDTKKQ